MLLQGNEPLFNIKHFHGLCDIAQCGHESSCAIGIDFAFCQCFCDTRLSVLQRCSIGDFRNVDFDMLVSPISGKSSCHRAGPNRRVECACSGSEAILTSLLPPKLRKAHCFIHGVAKLGVAIFPIIKVFAGYPDRARDSYARPAQATLFDCDLAKAWIIFRRAASRMFRLIRSVGGGDFRSVCHDPKPYHNWKLWAPDFRSRAYPVPTVLENENMSDHQIYKIYSMITNISSDIFQNQACFLPFVVGREEA